jgi:hypothetical protein
MTALNRAASFRDLLNNTLLFIIYMMFFCNGEKRALTLNGGQTRGLGIVPEVI